MTKAKFNPKDYEWLQAAIECAEHTYHLNQDYYDKVEEHDRMLGRKSSHNYRMNHPDAIKARARRQRKSKDGNWSVGDLEFQMRTQNNRCWWCSKKIKNNKYHVDHVIPLARGGTNLFENIVVSCPTCNHKKGSKTPAEFMGRLF